MARYTMNIERTEQTRKAGGFEMVRKKKAKKKPKVLHFKSKEAYRKWLAYNYIHNRRKMQKPPHKVVYIRGKRKEILSRTWYQPDEEGNDGSGS